MPSVFFGCFFMIVGLFKGIFVQFVESTGLANTCRWSNRYYKIVWTVIIRQWTCSYILKIYLQDKTEERNAAFSRKGRRKEKRALFFFNPFSFAPLHDLNLLSVYAFSLPPLTTFSCETWPIHNGSNPSLHRLPLVSHSVQCLHKVVGKCYTCITLLFSESEKCTFCTSLNHQIIQH